MTQVSDSVVLDPLVAHHGEAVVLALQDAANWSLDPNSLPYRTPSPGVHPLEAYVPKFIHPLGIMVQARSCLHSTAIDLDLHTRTSILKLNPEGRLYSAVGTSVQSLGKVRWPTGPTERRDYPIQLSHWKALLALNFSDIGRTAQQELSNYLAGQVLHRYAKSVPPIGQTAKCVLRPTPGQADRIELYTSTDKTIRTFPLTHALVTPLVPLHVLGLFAHNTKGCAMAWTQWSGFGFHLPDTAHGRAALLRQAKTPDPFPTLRRLLLDADMGMDTDPQDAA